VARVYSRNRAWGYRGGMSEKGDIVGEVLAPVVVRQQEILFGNLPPGEVDEDAQLHFGFDGEGHFLIGTADALYILWEGDTLRYQTVSATRGELTTWRDGKMIELQPLSLEDDRWLKRPMASA